MKRCAGGPGLIFLSVAGSESPLESVRADAGDDEENAKGGPCEDDAGNEGVYAGDVVTAPQHPTTPCCAPATGFSLLLSASCKFLLSSL